MNTWATRPPPTLKTSPLHRAVLVGEEGDQGRHEAGIELFAEGAHEGLGHPGEGQRGDGVGLDVVLRAFDGEHPGEPDEAHLRRAVVGLAEVAEDPCGRRSADDPAVALLAHDHPRRLGDVEGALAGERRAPSSIRSGSMLWKALSRRMPALLMTTSTLPKASSAVCTMALPPSGVATELVSATASPPAALISSTTFSAAPLSLPLPSMAPPRSLITTSAPREAMRSACWRPRPPPAPVMMTTLPSKPS